MKKVQLGRVTALKMALMALNVNATTMGHDLNIPRDSMSNYISGRMNPNPERRKLIINYLKRHVPNIWAAVK